MTIGSGIDVTVCMFCPICNENIPESHIYEHIHHCLQKVTTSTIYCQIYYALCICIIGYSKNCSVIYNIYRLFQEFLHVHKIMPLLNLWCSVSRHKLPLDVHVVQKLSTTQVSVSFLCNKELL